MTEEEFKSAMSKIVIFIVIMLVVLILIGIFIFNNSGKSVSVFSDENQKSNYQNAINNNKSSQISDEEANKIDGSSEFSTDENVVNQENTNVDISEQNLIGNSAETINENPGV